MLVEEDNIVETDEHSVILHNPTNNTSNMIVRVNDFKRNRNQLTEILMKEEVTSQFTGANNAFFVQHGPIFDGLKVGNITSNISDVTVKIHVTDEDVSGQFTGSENFFYVNGKILLRSNLYDFSSEITKKDILVKVNGFSLTENDILNITPLIGRIELKEMPLQTDVVTVSYFYKARPKNIDGINGKITIKETPVLGQSVYVAYYSQQNDGWEIISNTSNKNTTVYFTQKRITNRLYVENENETPQFTGRENFFYTTNKPLLPLFQDYIKGANFTLNSAIKVYVNGSEVKVIALNAYTGKVIIGVTPEANSIILANYYYEDEKIADKISVDYSVNNTSCSKCNARPNLLMDYSITATGNYSKVENEYKLSQDLKKIIVTDILSDKVATWYGTNFKQIVGTQAILEIAKSRINIEITQALEKLKNAQFQQQQFQKVTDGEFLNYVKSINIEQNVEDETYFRASVDVVTQSGKEVAIEQDLFLRKT